MEQRENTNDAALSCAQVLLGREECALGMVQRSNDAALKIAKVLLKREECASNMEQRPNDAALKDALIIPNEEECVGDTVHTAIPLMSLQLSHHALDQNLIRLL